MKRKLIAAMLAGVMMLSLLPTPLSPIALAVGETLISNRAGLEAIKSNLSGSYLLTADIDLAGESWTPLPAFSGKLDGGDHIIKNLSITDTNENYNGLFASIAGTGRVCNLGLERVNITTGNNAGAIAGTNNGKISRCYTTGTVSGNAYAGGIAGANGGTIENCYSRVSVSGTNYLGGLAGSNSGKITKSYAASTVTDSVMSNYLQFNSGGYVSIPHKDIYKTDNFTLEAWFQWGSAGTDRIEFIFGKGFEKFEIHTGGGSGVNGIRFIPVPEGGTATTTDGYRGDSYIDVHNVLQAGWFHVAAVYSYDNATETASVQVYVNGEAQDLWQKPSASGAPENKGKTATILRSMNPLEAETNNEAINIGKRNQLSADYYFNGKIADVRFWNTARTGGEIKANKDKVLTGTEDGLVGYWKLNDNLSTPLEGKQVADVSINHNSGTIHGDVTQTTATGTALNKGALTGSNSGGAITSCFYDSTLYGSASGGAGTAKATADMKNQSTYTGWDFDAVWRIVGSDYPNLGFKTVTSVSVTPVSPSVIKGGTRSFSATVTGANNPAQTVTWSVTGGIAGTGIDANGNLTVAAGETAKELTVKATSTVDTTKSGTATVTVAAATHGITVSPATLDFGTANVGYTQPAEQTVTVSYTGNIGSVTLTQPTSTDYEISTLSRTVLDTTNKTATFTIQPKANLLAGTHDLPIDMVTTPAQESPVIVTPSFTVNGAFSVGITGDLDIIAGESTVLTANAAGGSGIYTYQWFKGEETTAFFTTNPVTVSPTVTTTYKVVAYDTIEGKNAKAKVTVAAATHGITINPATLDFGTASVGYTRPAVQTVTVTYTGNIGQVTLTQPTSTDYELGTLSATTLNTRSKTATFTVRPKAGLGMGTHNTPISIATTPAQASALTVTPSFTVVNIQDLLISPGMTFLQGSAPETTVTVGTGITGFGLSNLKSVEMGPKGGALTTLSKGTEYDAAEGSIIVTLHRSYLNTLMPGVYTLRIYLKNLPGQSYPSYVETTITVNVPGAGGDLGADVPKTGDSATPMLWLGLILLAGAGLAGRVIVRRRRQNG